MICPICSSSSISYQSEYRFNHSCFENLNRVACKNCGLQFSNPMPSTQKLISYNNSYHLSAHGGFKRTKKQKAFFSALAKTRMDFIKKNVDTSNSKVYKVLEVGPGPGSFLKVWMDNFPKTRYCVLESDKNCYPILNELGATILENSNFEQINLKFDFLIISHVLEHVKDPIKFLSPFVGSLKKNGFAFIEVPCNDWDHKKIDEPHLLFFDKKPMLMLLEKLNVYPIKISYSGIPIEILKNKKLFFLKKIGNYLRRVGINLYHPERKYLKDILLNNLEANAILNFDAHKEQKVPSWWLRTIFKNT